MKKNPREFGQSISRKQNGEFWIKYCEHMKCTQSSKIYSLDARIPIIYV